MHSFVIDLRIKKKINRRFLICIWILENGFDPSMPQDEGDQKESNFPTQELFIIEDICRTISIDYGLLNVVS